MSAKYMAGFLVATAMITFGIVMLPWSADQVWNIFLVAYPLAWTYIGYIWIPKERSWTPTQALWVGVIVSFYWATLLFFAGGYPLEHEKTHWVKTSIDVLIIMLCFISGTCHMLLGRLIKEASEG